MVLHWNSCATEVCGHLLSNAQEMDKKQQYLSEQHVCFIWDDEHM